MGNIIENLKKILEARYGKDVRQAIHDSIENCYNDGKAGSIDLQARHDIEEMGTEIATVESIAKGKNQARGFSTTESMKNWLSDSANKGVANVGDNMYIVAVDVPDWWISSVLEEPNESGMYYEIAQLETQKVDLTTIEIAINSIDSKIGSTDISEIGDGTLTGGLSTLNSNLKTLLKTEKITFSGNYSQGTVTLVLSKDIGDYRIIALSDVYDYYGIFSIDRWDIQTENTIRIMFNCKNGHDNNGYVNVLCIKK